ncbi:phytoene dehydrogenase-like protein [Diaminobutyricimonas aerilata]|uniref:Phytoene dehydrogenase-like protein n=1 Tax=Diaminobutyricimonas aerilata TaxID=1162967 RepID=A0A2M9CIV1_9MICO|nr:NAD(P)/FAD-dependent oxidoreductase [Diaminobutyricimonas aerilata]PJJ71843.1 phytoene dehydrogenase-like protein [Diaminobutyricimonas aerilata]
MSTPDAVVVGAGPNGLAAAVTLARRGLHVRVYERASTAGGGTRTLELTLPGFRHDWGSAVHPMAFASPFFRRLGIRDRVEFVTPEVSYAHPLDGARAGLAYRDLDRAADVLGVDGAAWRNLFAPLVRAVRGMTEFVGGPVLRVPRHPVTAVRFGLRALEQGGPWWNARWRDEVAPALLTGVFAHTIRPLPNLAPAAAGLVLGVHAHAEGWPVPVGGSQAIADALLGELLARGGELVLDHEVSTLEELPPSRVTLLDLSPRAFVRLAGDRLSPAAAAPYRRFRYGNGVAKVDYALSGPVPWAAAGVDRTATVHLGGSRAEIAASEREVFRGRHPESPYVLVSQPTLFDRTRAPEGRHTLWAYTHVPAGSTVDREDAVTAQIERFAPGFRDLVLATSSRTAADLERENPNYVGGDIAAGDVSLAQLLARPVAASDPWRTPVDGVYLCSSSTAPGPGVHGLAGWHAARAALRREFGGL